jgi:hypothetical protein
MAVILISALELTISLSSLKSNKLHSHFWGCYFSIRFERNIPWQSYFKCLFLQQYNVHIDNQLINSPLVTNAILEMMNPEAKLLFLWSYLFHRWRVHQTEHFIWLKLEWYVCLHGVSETEMPLLNCALSRSWVLWPAHSSWPSPVGPHSKSIPSSESKDVKRSNFPICVFKNDVMDSYLLKTLNFFIHFLCGKRQI